MTAALIMPHAADKLSPAPFPTGTRMDNPTAATARDTDTADLTSAMAAGDEAAVELFYRRHFDRLYREARRASARDESFCLDIVQESVLRIIRAVRRVESERQLLAWLRLVVRTTAYDMLRAEKRRRVREAAAIPVLPQKDQDDEERLTWLRGRLRSFDPKLARMIELRYHQRWSLSRIAAVFELSIGTIDGRLRRALDHLRALAREELDE